MLYNCITMHGANNIKCHYTLRYTDSLLSRRESLQPFINWFADQSYCVNISIL